MNKHTRGKRMFPMPSKKDKARKPARKQKHKLNFKGAI